MIDKSKLNLVSVDEARKELAQYRQIEKDDIAFFSNDRFSCSMVNIFNCPEVKGFPIDKEIEYDVVPGCVHIGKNDPYLLIRIEARGRVIKLAFSFNKHNEFIDALSIVDVIMLHYGKAPKNTKGEIKIKEIVKSAVKGGLAIDNKNFISDLRDIIKIVKIGQQLIKCIKN